MRTILVVDDEKPTLKMFGLLLDALGYEAITASNGRDGVEAFRYHEPEIVLTDIKMPRMDGIALLREIKALSPRTEVVVITGHGDMDLAMQALELDATDFINKPVQRQSLLNALERAEHRLAFCDSEQEQVQVIEDGGKGVIFLQGNLTSLSERALRRGLARGMELGDQQTMLLRFDESASINGAAISTLCEMVKEFHSRGGVVRMEGVSENLRTIFKTIGLSRLVSLAR